MPSGFNLILLSLQAAISKYVFLLKVELDIARLERHFTKCARTDSSGCQLRSEGEWIKKINNIRMQSSTAASQGQNL